MIFLWRSHDFCVKRLRDFFGGSVIFVRRGCMIFCVCGGGVSFCEERLRDVLGWRGCVIFPNHLLTRLREFFCGEVA